MSADESCKRSGASIIVVCAVGNRTGQVSLSNPFEAQRNPQLHPDSRLGPAGFAVFQALGFSLALV